MSELQRFLPADQDFLVGIFYRVGYWISHVDDTDLSSESETAERKQMMTILGKIADASRTAPIVRELAAEALRQTVSWPRWEEQNLAIEDDVRKATLLLKGQATDEEYKSFSNAVMVIATSVARAFREIPENKPEHENYLSWLGEKAGELVLSLKDRSAHKDMNISPAEDTALSHLHEILWEAA